MHLITVPLLMPVCHIKCVDVYVIIMLLFIIVL